jgi:hypothetical protein
MKETLIEKVSGIQLRGDDIKKEDFSKYQTRVEFYTSDCCYGADCGDCDSDGDGYCIDPD